MSVRECPECGTSEVREVLTTGRKTQFQCRDCSWHSEPRTPKRRPISAIQTVDVDQFGGIIFEIFDKYGQPMVHSRTYHSRSEAVKALEKEIEKHERHEGASPCTAVLWPAMVTVKGEKFKMKKGKLVRV